MSVMSFSISCKDQANTSAHSLSNFANSHFIDDEIKVPAFNSFLFSSLHILCGGKIYLSSYSTNLDKYKGKIQSLKSSIMSKFPMQMSLSLSLIFALFVLMMMFSRK